MLDREAVASKGTKFGCSSAVIELELRVPVADKDAVVSSCVTETETEEATPVADRGVKLRSETPTKEMVERLPEAVREKSAKT